ncbi:SDR family NAD(P)-dependent oxidoreductase [Allomesorhizobium camelthorni]|uniref:SDR family oxidoreductase n=1 Tax=Allomesorhizobium camelthorni TaxID=475069 RepID=A0A6G4WP43_9HYPH|nr:SDR family oxidoreductase [Mesorhizobium camelthorni]NGO55837.1 SDR family oxidoreductase [Mesorhizobium camelthorni]
MTIKRNKIAIVTGGGRGIGRAIVTRLRNDGAQVVTCGRGARPQDLDESVLWVKADVSKTEDAKRIVNAALELGPISVLVNNAGIQVEKTVRDTTDDDWCCVVDVNCKGVFNMCREVLPGMTEGGGAIINLGSIAGIVSEPSMAIYNASKAFVHSLTRSIAVDYGPTVRCNAVCPGWILTALSESAFALAKDPAKAKADALARHPARRFGRPEDVANTVAWLVSDESEFVTGQCFTIDGGLTVASPIQPGLF